MQAVVEAAHVLAHLTEQASRPGANSSFRRNHASDTGFLYSMQVTGVQSKCYQGATGSQRLRVYPDTGAELQA
jgi:hypothetical protein